MVLRAVLWSIVAWDLSFFLLFEQCEQMLPRVLRISRVDAMVKTFLSQQRMYSSHEELDRISKEEVALGYRSRFQ